MKGTIACCLFKMKNSGSNKLNTYIINLQSDISKKEKITKLLQKTNFDYQFFNAVEANKLNENHYKGYKNFFRMLCDGKSLNNKEIAIFNSHIDIIKTIVGQSIPHALILEDDCFFPKDFEPVLNKIIKINYEWDVIRFIGSKKFSKYTGRKVLKISNNYYLERLPKLPGGAHAYLVSLRGAKKILSQSKTFYAPYDIFLGYTWLKNMNVLYLKPGLAKQLVESQESNYQDPRFIKPKKSIFSIIFYSRILYKLYESIFKWGHYLFFMPSDYLRFLKEKKINFYK